MSEKQMLQVNHARTLRKVIELEEKGFRLVRSNPAVMEILETNPEIEIRRDVQEWLKANHAMYRAWLAILTTITFSLEVLDELRARGYAPAT